MPTVEVFAQPTGIRKEQLALYYRLLWTLQDSLVGRATTSPSPPQLLESHHSMKTVREYVGGRARGIIKCKKLKVQ